MLFIAPKHEITITSFILTTVLYFKQKQDEEGK